MSEKVISLNKKKDWSDMTAIELMDAAKTELSSREDKAVSQRAVVITLYDYDDDNFGIQVMNTKGLADYEILGLLAQASKMIR